MEIPKLTKNTSDWEAVAILAVKKLGWFWVTTSGNHRYLLANEDHLTYLKNRQPRTTYERVTEGKWPKEYATGESISTAERYSDWAIAIPNHLTDKQIKEFLLERDSLDEEDSEELPEMSTLDKIYYSRAITIVLFGEEREPVLADLYEISSMDKLTRLKVEAQARKLKEQEAF